MKTKNKIEIKSIWGTVLWTSEKETVKEAVIEAIVRYADLRYADLRYADLRYADLRSADLRYADLRYADLRYATNLPQSYINFCSRDMLFIFEHLKGELPFLREKLMEGKVDGTCYKGDCACLIGTLANADGGIDNVCSTIPFYEKGLENFAEQWFWNIKIGDTPDKSFFAKHAVELIDSVLNPVKVKEDK